MQVQTLPAPLFNTMNSFTISNGTFCIFGGPSFYASEASYIQAMAGNLVSGAHVSSVGITSTESQRWLMEATAGNKIRIVRSPDESFLDPAAVLRAFRGAGYVAQMRLVTPEPGKHLGYRTPYVEKVDPMAEVRAACTETVDIAAGKLAEARSSLLRISCIVENNLTPEQKLELIGAFARKGLEDSR